MNLDSYVERLREQLAIAAAAGDAEVRGVAERLSDAMDPAVRLVLLEALSAAAAEITQEIAPSSVEVRLRGRDPDLVVTATPAVPEAWRQGDSGPEPQPWAYAAEDAAMVRINLRLPQELKDRVEESARASGLSVNAWLVRSAAAAASGSADAAGSVDASARSRQRVSGWVR